MAVSAGFQAYIMEQLEPFGTITSRRLFGGLGIYVDGFYCAFIHNDCLYFKVDDTNRPDFELEQMEPFRPFGDERAMDYYEVPVTILEDRDQLQVWLGKAQAVAKKGKPRKRKKG